MLISQSRAASRRLIPQHWSWNVPSVVWWPQPASERPGDRPGRLIVSPIGFAFFVCHRSYTHGDHLTDFSELSIIFLRGLYFVLCVFCCQLVFFSFLCFSIWLISLCFYVFVLCFSFLQTLQTELLRLKRIYFVNPCLLQHFWLRRLIQISN